VWIRGLLCEVGQCPGKVPTLIYHDNQGLISYAEGGLRKVKHVGLKYHFTQHLIQSEQAKVTYVRSEDSCADDLTKALAGSQFKKMCQGLFVFDREGLLMNGVFFDHHTQAWRIPDSGQRCRRELGCDQMMHLFSLAMLLSLTGYILSRTSKL
jgi:hypothetical protein